MKILTIGDLHGSNIWEDIVPFVHLYDKIVFIGDYMDSFDKTNDEIFQNLIKLLDFKRANLDKVVLLWGNHDLQYFHRELQGFTVFAQGMRGEMLPLVMPIFEQANDEGLLQVAFQYDNFLFTHAGVTEGWWKIVNEQVFNLPHRFSFLWENGNIADKLNALLTIKSHFLISNSFERGGSSYHGGPLWATSSEMKKNPLEGFHHIVGHTKMDEIWTHRRTKYSSTSVTFIDVIDNRCKSYPNFLVLDV